MYLGWDRFPEPLASIEIKQFFGLTGAELACVQARPPPSCCMSWRLSTLSSKSRRVRSLSPSWAVKALTG